MIRVLIADDQAVVRDGLRVILDAQDDIDVIGEAVDGADVIQLVPRRKPDVVVMDIRMPRIDGIEATRRLRGDDPMSPRILVLTTFGEDRYVYEALRAGASGFLLKDAQRAELIEAVRLVASGEQVLSPDVTRRVIEQFVQRRPPSNGTPRELAELTARELDVTRLLARGLSNAEIAGQLTVSPGTVKSHVAHVLLKLGLRDRIQVVVLAYETGFVHPDENAGLAE